LSELGSLLPDREIAHQDRERIGQLVCQIYHELYLERVIVAGTGALSADGMKWPFYRITDHGLRILQTREYSPYNPDGYLARLRTEIPNIDETIIRYVAESVKCLRVDCLLAAAVTLGCGSEKAMLLLIERFGQAITNVAQRQQYERDTETWIISRKYSEFRKRLDKVASDLPRDLRDPLKQRLDGTFDLIRQIRNDAGHPTGAPITVEILRASHIVFPEYCKYVYSLMDHFAAEGVNL